VHVVVVGCGRVGSALAVALEREGHSVCIMDKSEASFRRLPEDWNGEKVVGLGFDRGALEKAGASSAGGLAAVTSGDNSNILTARIARDTYQIPNVVARIYDPRRAEVYKRQGIFTVATVPWTVDRVMKVLFPDSMPEEWSDLSGKCVLLERPLSAKWAGRKLSLLSEPGRIRIALVTRLGEARLDVEDMVGQEGDVLYAMVRRDFIAQFDERFQDSTSDSRGGLEMTPPDAGSGPS
jgi:trk system potassium uptake protein TrkA